MTKIEFERKFWNQYLMKEKEFIEALKYVEFDVPNYPTYSTEFAKLLLELGSEVDNALKSMCGLPGRVMISDYAPIILGRYTNITSQVLKVLDSSITLTPFFGWNASCAADSLVFWKKYNNVKHDRINNFVDASLESVDNTLAGLFVLEMFQMNDLYNADPNEPHNLPDEESQIFYLDNWSEHMRISKTHHHYSVFDDEEGIQLL